MSTALSQMEELLSQTDSSISRLQDGPSNSMDEINGVEKQLESVQAESPEEAQRIRQRILTSTFDQVRMKTKQEEKDLAQAVLGLNALVEKLGLDYAKLQELNPEEQKLIEDAKQAVIDAQNTLNEVQNSWMPFGKAGRIKTAEQAIVTAQDMVKQTEVEAHSRMRQRLMNHSMEDSLQDFQMKVEKTIAIMKDRLSKIELQVVAVGQRKAKAYEAEQLAAKALEIAEQEENRAVTDLMNAENDLVSYQSGSSDYSKQKKKISDAANHLEEVKARKNEALGLLQSKEKFTKELGVHEIAQQKLLANQRVWIRTLSSDTEERVVTFKSRLEAMKSASDQEVAKALDELGQEIDQENIEAMAAISVASDDILIKKVKEHPDRIRRHREVEDALNTHLSRADEEIRNVVKNMKENYGLDPVSSQFS